MSVRDLSLPPDSSVAIAKLESGVRVWLDLSILATTNTFLLSAPQIRFIVEHSRYSKANWRYRSLIRFSVIEGSR